MSIHRADELLLLQGLCDSRSKAQALIEEGQVWLGEEQIKKASKKLPSSTLLSIKEHPRYVSRGGDKLAAFIDQFDIDVEGRHALDVGASTGGFTDCLLQNGAKSVTCVDVGREQLHKKIKEDPRVTNLEKTNARYLKPGDLPQDTYDLAVMDVSFISVTKILPTVWPWIEAEGYFVILVKPQFEATKEEMDRCKGVIKDEGIQARTLHEVIDFCKSNLKGCEIMGHIDSPIAGSDGNREFLLGLKKSAASQGAETPSKE